MTTQSKANSKSPPEGLRISSPLTVSTSTDDPVTVNNFLESISHLYTSVDIFQKVTLNLWRIILLYIIT